MRTGDRRAPGGGAAVTRGVAARAELDGARVPEPVREPRQDAPFRSEVRGAPGQGRRLGRGFPNARLMRPW